MTARPLHFWHRIVQREGKYNIQSTCVQCGEERTAARTEDIVDWEHEHACGAVAMAPALSCANEQPEEEGLIRRILRFLFPGSRHER